MKSSKQSEVLQYLNTVESAKKSDIYQNVKFGYFLNWEKHLGELLSRMVKRGMIERVERGVYKVRHLPKVNWQKDDVDPNQTQMF